jgi:serine phosphatase RsbU (regulator of sigma subunit)
MVGSWDAALDYLEAGVDNGDSQSHSDLLPATIQSIYAAQDLEEAAHFLIRGLLAGFGSQEIQVWYALPGERRLRLIGNTGQENWTAPEIQLKEDRLEVRAFRQAAVLRGGEVKNTIQRAIPLTISGSNPVGVVTLRSELDESQIHIQRERDLQMLGYLNQAARALQTVGKRRQELTLAGRMQASLLPESPPSPEKWQISAIWKPARETSGDFYDFIEFNDDRIGVVLADVTDKGMGAALYMALSRTLIRTFAAEHPDKPAAIFSDANQRILADTHGGMFITMFYGLLDLKSGLMTYCNAGHHPPYLIRMDRNHKPEGLSRTGLPLGVSQENEWGEGAVQLTQGDLLLLYTDGVVEAHNSKEELFGDKRMLEIASSLKHRSVTDIQDAILSEMQVFSGSKHQFDDLTLVLIKRD